MELSQIQISDRGQWGTVFLFLAMLVGVVVLSSFVSFLTKVETLPNSALMWVSIGLVGVGFCAVYGGFG